MGKVYKNQYYYTDLSFTIKNRRISYGVGSQGVRYILISRPEDDKEYFFLSQCSCPYDDKMGIIIFLKEHQKELERKLSIEISFANGYFSWAPIKKVL